MAKAKKKTKHANRGMDLENMITNQCQKYWDTGVAHIKKIPTDWVVIRKYIPSKKRTEIVTAFPKEKSTVDHMGEYGIRSIAIEAKQTNNKTSFPFNNIKDHQWEFFKDWRGLGYYIIWFKELNRYFLVKAEDFQVAKDTLDRKSAPLDWFEDYAVEMDGVDFIKYIEEDVND